MSFPADGMDPNHRNSIEEVKNMMESQHSGHYTVFNLAEKSYPASRYIVENRLNPVLTVQLNLYYKSRKDYVFVSL